MQLLGRMIFHVSLLCFLSCSEDSKDSGETNGTDDSEQNDELKHDDNTVESSDTRTGYQLCDSTDDIRLAVISDGGGDLEVTFDFTNPYGHSFLFVTGKCEFLVGKNLTRGLRTGAIDEQLSARIETELRLDELPGWATHTDLSCPDASYQYLRTANGYGECSCGCDDDAPEHLDEALQASFRLMEELYESGASVDTPVELMAFAAGMLDHKTYQRWPFSFDIAKIAVDKNAIYEDPSFSMPEPLVLTGDDARMARELRDAAFALPENEYDDVVRVKTDDELSYELYLCDLVPEEWKNAIGMFQD